MYHEVTTKERQRRRRNVLVALCVIAALVALLALGVRTMQLGAREQGATALRQSIMDAAVRCCAVEGAYPLTLRHLEESYGLRINHDDYVITYEAYASNIAPSVVVVPR